jgi:hypothetical protein
MKLIFEATKNNRIKSQMTELEAVDHTWAWNCDLKKWTQDVTNNKYSYSSHRPCRSVRAFRRMLKNAPKDVKFKLWNKYEGHDVYGLGSAPLTG